MKRAACLFSFMLVLSLALSANAEDCSLCEIGKRIYTEGIGSNGQALVATVQGDVTISGTQLSCISCHRRSGLGASESNVFIPPITAEKLYAPKEQRRQQFYQKMYQQQASNPALRAAYTDSTLLQAISDGQRPDGHPLSMLMPRFKLNEQDQRALLAYLKTLKQDNDPGVDKQYLHFATIIGPEVTAEEANALTSVLKKYFQLKNAATRGEDKRAAKPFWFKRGNWDAYRKWKLHIWQLKGAADTWAKQLNEFYNDNKVFAVLSPIAHGTWQPIHEFCEQEKIPCLWPQTDLPTLESDGLFSIYFSRGMALEAESLAKITKGQDLLQVVGADRRARYAAKKLAEKNIHSKTIELSSLKNISQNYDNIVLWLKDEEIKQLISSGWRPASTSKVYISDTLSKAESIRKTLGKGWAMYRHSLPGSKSRGQRKAAAWFKQQDIKLTYPTLQTDAYFACTLLTGTVKKLQDVYSRQYLIEKIEHMTENSVSTASYSHLSLAPDQRFASKGVYFLPFGENSAKTQWIIP